MLAYVTMHLTNHAMGLVSIGAMERMLVWVSGFWSLPPMQLLLYGSFTIHYALALYALWRLRTLRMPLAEAFRLILGFVIPVLLLRHVVSLRLAHAAFGTEMANYSYVLWVFFVRSPASGLQQLLVLVVTWVHATLGVHFWLKFRTWYGHWQPPALILAVLLPTLSLLGTIEAGRKIAGRAADPNWPGAAFEAMALPPPAVEQSLSTIVAFGTCFFIAALIAVLLARVLHRWWERRHGSVRISYPNGTFIDVTRGTSVLEASRIAGIPHASICGGRGRCSTCRIRVRGALGAIVPASDDEHRVLRRISAVKNVRLACMLRPAGPVEVTPLLPAFTPARDVRRPTDIAVGAERIVAILFADIRGFTALSENRLPYDIVFILNRYFDTVGRAVESAGGHIDKFIGDGVMALFGMESGPEDACCQALLAARLMSERLVELNSALAGDIENPLCIGIGIHVGAVIIGEMGYRSASQLTAIGDAVNVASRLEHLAKMGGVELALSDETAILAGINLSAFPIQAIEIRGRRDILTVRLLTSASDLPLSDLGSKASSADSTPMPNRNWRSRYGLGSRKSFDKAMRPG